MKKLIPLLVFVVLFSLHINYALSREENVRTCPTGSTCINNPINTNSPQELIGKIIQAVLGISGSLALLMFVYGGFVWMMSGGNSEKVTKGKNTLVWASIGLVVIFSSYAMVKFIFTGLGA